MSYSKLEKIRELYSEIVDKYMTPFIIVDAEQQEVIVPQKHIHNGKIILNISYDATHNLRIGDDALECDAKFDGISFHLYIPISAILGIYAQEDIQNTSALQDTDDNESRIEPEYTDNIIPLRPKTSDKTKS